MITTFKQDQDSYLGFDHFRRRAIFIIVMDIMKMFAKHCLNVMVGVLYGVFFALVGCRRVEQERMASIGTFMSGITALHYCEYGAPFSPVEDMFIDFNDCRIAIRCFQSYGDFTVGTNAFIILDHKCDFDEWSYISRKLMDASIHSWQCEYRDANICDGTYWIIDLIGGTNVVKRISGANDWPDSFDLFLDVKKFAMNHPLAVRRQGKISNERAREIDDDKIDELLWR